jgi:hypothetical protein
MKTIIALTALFFAGCVFQNTNDQTKPIFPLATGNTWAYVDSAYFGGDSVSTDSTHLDVIGTRTVAFPTGEQSVYLLNARAASGQPGAMSTWVQNRRDGNHTIGAQQGNATFQHDILHIKYPAESGELYTTYFYSFRTEGDSLIPVIDTLQIEVVNADTTCTVPAGTFSCVHYRGWKPVGVLFADTYYAPGVGYLGSTQLRTIAVNGIDREVRIVRRLASYVLFWPLY